MKLQDRYKGLSSNRIHANPLEQVFAEHWQEECENGTLEYLLSGDRNQREAVVLKTQIATNTVIQWLGSPEGQAFLIDVFKRGESLRFLEHMLGDPILHDRVKKILRR